MADAIAQAAILGFAASRPIDAGWQLCLTEAGACETPAALPDPHHWIDADAPGTAAGALGKAGRFDPAMPFALDDYDIWYRVTIEGDGPHTLRFGGLAAIADVWLDDAPILRSESMFRSHEIEVALSGSHRLVICFRSLTAYCAKPQKRARWRPRMIQPTALNAVRTSILGHAPGWCPNLPIIGPYRPIELVSHGPAPAILNIDLRASMIDGTGWIDCSIELDRQAEIDPPTLHCEGNRIRMMRTTSPSSGRSTFAARLEIPSAERWWPHTHGAQRLYIVELDTGADRVVLGTIGFRSIAIDRGPDGSAFQLLCNDVPVFCRGACWTPVDLLDLPRTRAAYEPRLRQMREAGMNMIRIGGTMLYEEKSLHDLCDELGILVWQDFMFANFDYPASDEAFLQSVSLEASEVLKRLQTSPSLAVLCGGSEVYQQGAMLGMPERIWKSPLFEETLPALCRKERPDVPYVANSPSGGALPFFSDTGVAHYYGVGAYLRPLEDARRANIRFAAECLAFANIPDDRSLRRYPTDAWQHNVPRDMGADWDFAEVRDHYLRLVFGCEPGELRDTDLKRYLDLSRAAIAEVMRQTFAEWRSTHSTTGGALIWFLADFAFGSGWGVIDADGEPKSGWHALKQTLQPLQILLTDEGVNGLRLHIVNETTEARPCLVKLRCLREGSVPVVDGSRIVELAPRQRLAVAATDLFGAFFDTTYALRFGPPAHDVTIAELWDANGDALLSSFFHFPNGIGMERHDLGLVAALVEADEKSGWRLTLSATRLATFVQIDDDGCRAEDNWFHLSPGTPRTVRLTPRLRGAQPSGTVSALNGIGSIQYGSSA